MIQSLLFLVWCYVIFFPKKAGRDAHSIYAKLKEGWDEGPEK